jgi:hypothetical protein
MTILQYSEFMRNIALAIAVGAGGGWALWKWWYEQREKKRQEFLSVEGELKTNLVPLTNKRAVLTIESLWNNISTRHISIDPKTSYVRIYEVPDNKNVQALKITQQLGKPVIQSFPYQDSRWYILEAKSLNRLTAHFVVNIDTVYAIRWKLYRDKEKHGSSYAWTKELIISTKNIGLNKKR